MKHFYISFFAFLVLLQPMRSQNCTGAPAANTVISTNTLLCPGGSVTLTLQNPYTATGIIYQWVYSSTSPVGPWMPINAATFSFVISNNLSQGYYTCYIGCTASQQTTMATPIYLTMGSSTATASIPYYEDFENLASTGLPNCAWAATNFGTNSMTWFGAANSGVAMAGFTYSASAPGTNTFFTMGLQMNANVVYSVAVFNRTQSFQPSNNWSSFGLAVGPQQASAGSTVVSSAAPPSAGTYALRSGTFTVPTSGIYYVQVFATSVSGTTNSPQMYFDDLSVTIPCNSGSPNLPSATVSSPGFTMCAGDSVKATFFPSPSTTLALGSNTVYFSPLSTMVNTVIMTNTNTGCMGALNFSITVYPNAAFFSVATKNTICPNETVMISVLQNLNYTITLYPGGQTGFTHTVSPQVTTVYTISSMSALGCTANTTNTITVDPQPTLVLVPSLPSVCVGDAVTFTATGAIAYTIGANVFSSTWTIPSAQNNTSYVVTGKNLFGCTNTQTLNLNVALCSGIEENANARINKFYPVPAQDRLIVLAATGSKISLRSADGKVLQESLSRNAETVLDLQLYPAGVYFIRIETGTSSQTGMFIINH